MKSMSFDVGIVCGKCDWFNPRDGESCEHCGNTLTLDIPISFEGAIHAVTAADSTESLSPTPGLEPGAEASGDRARPSEEEIAVQPAPVPEIDEALLTAAEREGVTLFRPVVIGRPEEQEPRRGSEEDQMEQARHYVCKSCYSPIPGGHKFCGKCGAPTNFADDYGVTQYFGAMQVPNKAKLILIKGEGLDGISYHLNSTEHVAGRQQGAILFPDDSWLSPRHANFFYRDTKLFVRDEDSVNGVYLRIREPAIVSSGQMFLAGEQVFRLETAEALSDGAEADGTYFYASPTKNWSFRVVQILAGGIEGAIVHDDGGKLIIGREDCHMSFLQDRYLSSQHIEISDSKGEYTINDLDTQNGTFLRIDQERALDHGDYVFLGKQLLRVEVTP
jgi:ribosomal protein L40E